MKILLATDGSDHAWEAVRFLNRLAFTPAPEIILLTVLETSGLPVEIEVESGALRPLKTILRAKAEGFLTDQAQALRERFKNAQTRVREGNAADEIVQAAEEWGCDLVVTGAQGEHGLAGFLLGSVCFRVIQHAPCSVLVVRPRPDQATAGTPSRKLRIVLGTDGSDSSQAAARFLSESGMVAASRLRLIRVLTLIRAFRMDIIQQTSSAWIEEVAAARDQLAHLRASLGQPGSEVSDQLRQGEGAAEELMEAAKEFGADLLAVGSKGSGAIARFLLGSVSNKVAHHAPCSVLVVKTASEPAS